LGNDPSAERGKEAQHEVKRGGGITQKRRGRYMNNEEAAGPLGNAYAWHNRNRESAPQNEDEEKRDSCHG